MDHKKQIGKYIAGDMLSALLIWTLFYSLIINRLPGKTILESIPGKTDQLFVTGVLLYPFFWVLLYYFWGFYRDIFRRSRLKELGASITVALAGTLIIFLFLISTDVIEGAPGVFFNCFMSLLYIHFPVSYIPRLTITSVTISDIRKGRIGFNTLIIGSDIKAVDLYKELKNQIRSTGNKFKGFININGNKNYPMSRFLPHLGGPDRLNEIISKYGIEEVILAIESTDHDKIEGIIGRLNHQRLIIRAIPGMHDILTGRLKIDTIIETPLIRISHRLMPVWQKNLKQVIDIIFSVVALLLLIPVSIFIMIWIKSTSKGPAIYSHERIGKNGKPFMIYKFRTMINNAEKNGPELSSGNDTRITGPGRFLRKSRLDEIPNFVNVLKGDMSIVGPRPERKYYIDQIVNKAPHYNHLLKIKPGITSWGQVKYGYAENVDQMIQRLRYDIIYLENMSVFVDFQILILTVLTIFKRKGI